MEFVKWLKEQFEWLKSFASDKDGKASSKRLLSIITTVVMLSSYTKISWANKQIIELPWNNMLVILGCVGILAVSPLLVKSLTSDKEKKDV